MTIAEQWATMAATIYAGCISHPQSIGYDDDVRTRALAEARAILVAIHGEPCSRYEEHDAGRVAGSAYAMGSACRDCGWPHVAHNPLGSRP